MTTATTTARVDDQFTPTDWGLFLSVAGIWGASFLFIDIGLDALPPGVITLMRVGLGALALAVLPLARQHTKIRPVDRLRLLTLSITWVAVPFTLFPIAEQHISSAVTGLLNGGTPIFAAIFAMVLLRQPTRGPQLLGIAVGFVGVVLVSLPSIGDGSSEALGVVLVVLATVCYGFSITIAAPLQQRYGSVNLMAKMLALATIWTTPYGVWQIGDADWQLGPIIAVAVLGVVGTGIAFALMGTLVGTGRLDPRLVHHLPHSGRRAGARCGVPRRRRVCPGTPRRRVRDRWCVPREPPNRSSAANRPTSARSRRSGPSAASRRSDPWPFRHR